jgi:hypothetical protein
MLPRQPKTSNMARPASLSAALVFSFSVALIWAMADRWINVYDEGIILTGAMRVGAGEAIHRDFTANYGPAQFYLLAGLFEAFGRTMLVGRLLDAGIRGAICATIFSMLVPVVGRVPSWIAAGLSALWLVNVGNAGYPIYGALLAMLGAAWLMSRAMTLPPGPRASPAYAAAGTLTGIAALFRYDLGFFACVAGTAALFVSHAWHWRGDGPIRYAPSPACFAAYLGGSALPVALLLSAYALTDALGGFIHDVIVFPSGHYAATRSLPFPSPLDIWTIETFQLTAIYLPIAAIVLTGLVILVRPPPRAVAAPIPIHDDGTTHLRRAMIMVLGILAALAYVKGLVRTSIEHTQPALLISLTLAPLLLRETWGRAWTFRLAAVLLAAWCVAVTLDASWVRLPPRKALLPWGVPDTAPVGSAGAEAMRFQHIGPPGTGRTFLGESGRLEAVRYVIDHSPPDARVFVGTGRHDKIFVSDVSAYFLMGRLPATRWHHFDPGLQTSEAIQRRMIADIEATRPPLVWLETTWDGVREPNDSALSSDVRLLDAYLGMQYATVREFGSIRILSRREAPAAGPSPRADASAILQRSEESAR